MKKTKNIARRAVAWVLAALLASGSALGLAACSSSDSSDEGSTEATEETEEAEEEESDEESTETTEIVVFAAASMTESLEEIGELFEEEYPEYEVVFNFDSSGTLKTQIEEGAVCDVFISAGQLQMNQLDIEDDTGDNTDGLDFIYSETRFDILRNEVVLAVPEDNPAGIESFDQLAELLASGDVLMAMGNSDVPVGQYTQLILEYYGLDEEELANAGVITYGTNVKEVTTQVAEASVDCGVVYQTDAYSDGLTVVDTATEEMCGEVVYPAAVTKNTTDYDAAELFLEFLTTEEATECMEAVGFTALAAE